MGAAAKLNGSGKDRSEAAEVAVTGRWFQFLIVRGEEELNRTG